MDILNRIVELRQCRGWSEYQLAERSGVPQSTISFWYKKQMTPSFSSLEKVCEAFGITLLSQPDMIGIAGGAILPYPAVNFNTLV